jgi:hypothetical protein
MGLDVLLPILIKYVVIPEVANLVRKDPTITDADIIAKLPADIQALVTGNQAFLDSIRTQAGR